MKKKRVFAAMLLALLLCPAEPKTEAGEGLLALAERLSLTPTVLLSSASLEAVSAPAGYAREVFLSLMKNARGVSGSITEDNGALSILISSIPTKEAEKNARSVLRAFLENEDSVKHILKAEAQSGSLETIRKRLRGEIISETQTDGGTLIRLEGTSIFIGGGREVRLSSP